MCGEPTVGIRDENARAVERGCSPESPRRRWGAPPCLWNVEGRIPSREPGLREWQAQTPRGLRLAHPEVGNGRGERDLTHARTRWAPRTCNRSTVAFSRRTSREGARNKPQTISCQGGGAGALTGHRGPNAQRLGMTRSSSPARRQRRRPAGSAPRSVRHPGRRLSRTSTRSTSSSRTASVMSTWKPPLRRVPSAAKRSILRPKSTAGFAGGSDSPRTTSVQSSVHSVSEWRTRRSLDSTPVKAAA